MIVGHGHRCMPGCYEGTPPARPCHACAVDCNKQGLPLETPGSRTRCHTHTHKFARVLVAHVKKRVLYGVDERARWRVHIAGTCAFFCTRFLSHTFECALLTHVTAASTILSSTEQHTTRTYLLSCRGRETWRCPTVLTVTSTNHVGATSPVPNVCARGCVRMFAHVFTHTHTHTRYIHRERGRERESERERESKTIRESERK